MIVFIRTIILYIFVVTVMRIMGKRQIGELQPFELVIAIMLSELAAIPMQEPGVPLINGIIPILTLMILEVTISYLSLKFQFIRKIVCGEPSILIKDGKVLEEELRRQRFNLDDLFEELRLLNYFNINDIQYAILETNGKLSIIPKPDKAPLTKKDLNIVSPPEKLPISLILDGKLQKKNLEISGYDENWLKQQLKLNNIEKYEDVFIAMLDTKGQLFIQRR
ncbi:Uncharacterized membrane protein YcaP, DUF421 family [Caloramator fervidus]|uniref:Uncharacterized membrane protein YcaP, DUF421 family n=1 Tax=Caloramator fervidus TaxID=29344 RepID=A0A1H5SL59_9CLOT|nr:DUF421 domain-containing protein [Caloramator fervidus]SEF51353.1 Uncharacterized membrane protein YcaP, DUF421 family [Caloramator fervidus]